MVVTTDIRFVTQTHTRKPLTINNASCHMRKAGALSEFIPEQVMSLMILLLEKPSQG